MRYTLLKQAGHDYRWPSSARGCGLIYTFLLLIVSLLYRTEANAQHLTTPEVRNYGELYTTDTSGFLIANARSASCVDSQTGLATQSLKVTINSQVALYERNVGAQRGLNITVPVPKGASYLASVGCESTLNHLVFISIKSTPDLIGNPEPIRFNTIFSPLYDGVVVASASSGGCVEEGVVGQQRVAIEGLETQNTWRVEEAESISGSSMVVSAPIRANTRTLVSLHCVDQLTNREAWYFPFVGRSKIFEQAKVLMLGQTVVAETDGMLTLSGSTGACLAKGQPIQRTAVIVDGVTTVDAQTYGVNKSVSVSVPVRKGSRVLPEVVCPSSEIQVIFTPMFLQAAATVPQCADQRDNDSDGLIDLLDPGCSSATDNIESDATSECQDTVDNDGDGGIDYPGDFACSSPQDSREDDILAQCQDATDNDFDGKIDTLDPGCSSPQDNSERGELGECQDGIDNDRNGLIDLADSGCSSMEDTTEASSTAGLQLSTECVQDNRDGSFTAYFSYVNNTGSAIEVNATRAFSSTPIRHTLPLSLAQGASRGSVRVVFTSDSIRWTVSKVGTTTVSTDASRGSVRCAPITPIAGCIDRNLSGYIGTFGFVNPNPFAIELPVGGENQLLPSLTSTPPPTLFPPGNHPAYFTTSFVESVLWLLQATPAHLDDKSSVCSGGCVGVTTTSVRSDVHQSALALASITAEAAQFMRAQIPKLNSKAAKALLKADIRRAHSKANAFLKEAQELMIKVPIVIKNCPQAAQVCVTVSRDTEIGQIRALLVKQELATRRFVNRALFAKRRKVSRTHPLLLAANKTAKSGIAALDSLPATITTCE